MLFFRNRKMGMVKDIVSDDNESTNKHKIKQRAKGNG